MSALEFELLLDPPAPGAWNMAVDEALLEAAANDGQCTLRFYQWIEPTLSLGYFQAYADRKKHAASLGRAAVRRTSGGGAILHDFDLTYSLAVPQNHPLAADRLRTYRVVHDALVEVFSQWGIVASLWAEGPAVFPAQGNALGSGAEQHRVNLGGMGKEPFLCFQRRSPGDVVFRGEKVAGSAQRRCRGAVLQHGSVLFARSEAAPELPGLKELSGAMISVEEFQQAWLNKLSRALNLTWRRGELSEERRRRATALTAEKYASQAWTAAR